MSRRFLTTILLTAVLLSPEASAQTNDDTLRYARDLNVSSEEARRRLDLQDLAGDLDAELIELESETFAGLWIEHSPEFRIVVQHTTAGKPALPARFAGSSIEPHVIFRTVETTYADLVRTQELIIRALRRSSVRFDSGIDLQSNRVEIFALRAQPIRDALRAASFPLPRHAVIIEVPALSRDEADIYAGLSLSTCTAGWSVRDSAGVLGITTSGHCRSAQKSRGVSLPHVAEAYGGSCDVQWHKDASHTAVAKFVGSGANDVRTLIAIKPRLNQVVGGFVCKYGMTTDYTCGFIKTKNFKPSIPGANATFIRVHRDGVNLSEGGDSGGPWFRNNVGYGVHRCGIVDDACYMAIDYVQSCLGVTVLTQ